MRHSLVYFLFFSIKLCLIFDIEMLVARERLEMGRIEEINDRILVLQDIAIQEDIPESERSWYVGVRWYTEEEIARAKAEIAELEQELLELEA